MNKTELEIDFLKDKRNQIMFFLDKYAANYHHSIAWITALCLGLAAIVISLGQISQIWILFVGYLVITTMRLIQFVSVSSRVKSSLQSLNDSIELRYTKLGINPKKLKNEVKLI